MDDSKKIITSHSSRAKRAKEIIKNWPEKVSIFDREAFIEFLLLEEVLALFEKKYETELKRKAPTGRAGKMAHEKNLARFSHLKSIYGETVDVARALIDAGDFKIVWQTVPERNLMKAARNPRTVEMVESIGASLLKSLTDEALELEIIREKYNEDLDAIESHEANVRSVKGLPSMGNPADIKEVEDVVEEVKKNVKAILK